MKGGKKIPTVNAVARLSALGEEFRRRLRLSGINASVISKGAFRFEVTVPKDELEKLTPEEKEAVKRYLEHVAQTRDEERRRRRRYAASTSAPRQSTPAESNSSLCVMRGRARALGLRNTATHSEIKTALERKLREILGDEYEQWRDHIKITEGGKRLIITHQLLQRLVQNPTPPNKTKKLKNAHNTEIQPPRTVAPMLLTRRSRVQIPAAALIGPFLYGLLNYRLFPQAGILCCGLHLGLGYAVRVFRQLGVFLITIITDAELAPRVIARQRALPPLAVSTP
jgi:hypothetical protein